MPDPLTNKNNGAERVCAGLSTLILVVFCLTITFISNGNAAEPDTLEATASRADNSVTEAKSPESSADYSITIAESTESHADYSVTELEAIMKGEVAYKNKKGVVLRWKDTVDGGDSPMTSGCHLEYQTADCSDAGVYFGGDSCITARKLMEYTNAECHEREPIDLETYDCNKVCTDEGHWFGRCKIEANACDGQPSAYCRCFDRPPEL